VLSSFPVERALATHFRHGLDLLWLLTAMEEKQVDYALRPVMQGTGQAQAEVNAASESLC
jgi:hypothetical protein